MTDRTAHDKLSTTVRLYQDVVINHMMGRESFFDPSETHDMTLLTRQDHGKLRRVVIPRDTCPRARSAMSPSPNVSAGKTGVHCAVDYDRCTSRKWVPGTSADKFYETDMPFCVRPLHRFGTASRFMRRRPDTSQGCSRLHPSIIRETEERKKLEWNCNMVPFGKLVSRDPAPKPPLRPVTPAVVHAAPDSK